uniref:Uncharacterized protein n=1 Tax=Vibrio vulnificus TaxID=672 RepID=A0AAI9ELY7_VIBVL|nr:hypothetical protein [Vibrio vulnificus]
MTAKVVMVFPRKVWIESDIMGSRHVMVQHDDGVSLPFTYCSFFMTMRIQAMQRYESNLK